MTELIEALAQSMSAPRWLIALDRDGTLVPYASRPEAARVGPCLFTLIGELAKQPGFHVAVISARSVGQLRGDFDGKQVILAGNYGVEVCFPDGRLVVQPHASEAVPYLKKVRDQLACLLDLNSGVILEDHGYSLCVHCHMLSSAERDAVHAAIAQVAPDFPQVKFRRLPTSYEILPNMAWDKGLALSLIQGQLAQPGEDWFYFYSGDTEADTPAFLWVGEHGGISVRVGGTTNLRAQYHLSSPGELHTVLSYLVERRSQLFVPR